MRIDSRKRASGKANEFSSHGFNVQRFYIRNHSGRAGRFIDCYGHNMRFVPEHDCWFVWNGQRWRTDTDGAIERLALTMSRAVYEMAINVPAKDEASRRQLVKR